MHPRKVELVQKPTCKAKITSELLLKPLESNCGDMLKLLRLRGKQEMRPIKGMMN